MYSNQWTINVYCFKCTALLHQITLDAKLSHSQNQVHCLQQLFEDNQQNFLGSTILMNYLSMKKNSEK